MKTKNKCIEQMRNEMKNYLVLTAHDSVTPRSRNRRLKFIIQMAPNALFVVKTKWYGKNVNFYYLSNFFLNFYPPGLQFGFLLTRFHLFILILLCRDPLWVHFHRGFDPFVHVTGITSNWHIGQGYFSACIMHYPMTMSP